MRSVRWCWLVLLVAAFALCAAKADEFDQLRVKWFDRLTGGTNYNTSNPHIHSQISRINNAARRAWNSMNKSPTAYLWSDSESKTVSAQITRNYARLEAMALAYATRGCALYHNARLAADIQTGLNWMCAHRYNPDIREYGNWWDWEIGSPLKVADISVLMYDSLGLAGLTNSLAAVNYFTTLANPAGWPAHPGRRGTFTGANLADRIRITAVCGTVVKDSANIAAARNAMSSLFPYVTRGDGFYADGSFIQHRLHPYNGSYGRELLRDVSLLLPWLIGSPWQRTDPAQTNVVNWVYDSFEPFIYRGGMLDMTRGRAISRSSESEHVAGHEIIQDILALASWAPPKDAARMKSMVKYWMQSDTYRGWPDGSISDIVAEEQLSADNTVPPRGELLGHWTFASMDEVVHRRPGWIFALSMFSSRIANYEYMNGENAHGWFTGAGMTDLENAAGLGQYSDNFWPTVDPYHLAGTTVDTHPLANSAHQTRRSAKNWVGGATLFTDGAAGMDLKDVQTARPVTGKKSWFMFDDEVVCLGAGITSASDTAIHTTVEDRKIRNNAFVLDGANMPTALGWSTNPASVTWCELAGTGGYYFPNHPANVHFLRQSRTGSWRQINVGGSTRPYTRNYLTIWFDHGVKPANATYAYVLLPNFTASQVSRYAANPEVTILENTFAAQAVKDTKVNLVAANFWNASPHTDDFITCDSKASVLAQETRDGFAVAVADPTQTNTGSITLTLHRAAAGIISADPAITVSQLSPAIVMSVNVCNAHGRSFVARFAYAESPGKRYRLSQP